MTHRLRHSQLNCEQNRSIVLVTHHFILVQSLINHWGSSRVTNVYGYQSCIHCTDYLRSSCDTENNGPFQSACKKDTGDVNSLFITGKAGDKHIQLNFLPWKWSFEEGHRLFRTSWIQSRAKIFYNQIMSIPCCRPCLSRLLHYL